MSHIQIHLVIICLIWMWQIHTTEARNNFADQYQGSRKVCDKVSLSLYFKAYIILTAILFEMEDAFSRWQFLWKSKRVTRIYQDFFFLRFQVLFQMVVAGCKGNHYRLIKIISEPGYLMERGIVIWPFKGKNSIGKTLCNKPWIKEDCWYGWILKSDWTHRLALAVI